MASGGERVGGSWPSRGLPQLEPHRGPAFLVPCAPPQAPNKALASILGKSNLRFAGMSIAVSISIDGLNLSVPATHQVSAARPSPQPPPAPPAPPRAGSVDSPR